MNSAWLILAPRKLPVTWSVRFAARGPPPPSRFAGMDSQTRPAELLKRPNVASRAEGRRLSFGIPLCNPSGIVSREARRFQITDDDALCGPFHPHNPSEWISHLLGANP